MQKACCAILCALPFVTANLFAQTSTSGTVVGTVTDPSGAVTPNAEVQLLNVETNATAAQRTNVSGGYVFPNVAPGNYKISVKMTGFRAATVEGLVVQVNRSLSVPVQLEIGRETEVVEVTAAIAAQLQTQDSVIGNTVLEPSILTIWAQTSCGALRTTNAAAELAMPRPCQLPPLYPVTRYPRIVLSGDAPE